MAKFGMDLLLLKRFWTLLKIIFPTWKCSTAFLAIGVLGISFVDEVATYFVGVLPKREFTNHFFWIYHFKDF